MTESAGPPPAPAPGPARGCDGWHAGSAGATRRKPRSRLPATLLCIAWAVMSSGDTYAEQGEDFYEPRDRRNREHIAARYQQALARLGYQATLTPTATAPPPGPDTPPGPTTPRPS